MTWSRVQDGGTIMAAGSGTVGLTLTSVAAGDLLVLVSANYSAPLTSVSDGVNAWNLLGSGGNPYAEMWYAIVTTGGTLTINGIGASYSIFTITEFNAGAGMTISLDGSNVNVGTGINPASTLIANTVGDLLVGGFSSGSGTWSNFGNYIVDYNQPYTGGSNVGGALYYYLNSTSTPQTPTGQLSISAGWGAVGAAFKATPAPTGGVILPNWTGNLLDLTGNLDG